MAPSDGPFQEQNDGSEANEDNGLVLEPLGSVQDSLNLGLLGSPGEWDLGPEDWGSQNINGAGLASVFEESEEVAPQSAFDAFSDEEAVRVLPARPMPLVQSTQRVAEFDIARTAAMPPPQPLMPPPNLFAPAANFPNPTFPTFHPESVSSDFSYPNTFDGGMNQFSHPQNGFQTQCYFPQQHPIPSMLMKPEPMSRSLSMPNMGTTPSSAVVPKATIQGQTAALKPLAPPISLPNAQDIHRGGRLGPLSTVLMPSMTRPSKRRRAVSMSGLQHLASWDEGKKKHLK